MFALHDTAFLFSLTYELFANVDNIIITLKFDQVNVFCCEWAVEFDSVPFYVIMERYMLVAVETQ